MTGRPKKLSDRDALLLITLFSIDKAKEIESRWVKGGMPLMVKELYEKHQAVQHWAGLKLTELNRVEFPPEEYAECQAQEYMDLP